MPSRGPGPEEVVLLDSCCVINLYASGRLESILRDLPQTFAVVTEVVSESMFVRPLVDGDEPESIDLRHLVSSGLLQVIKLDGDVEASLFVEFAGRYRLDDGEAMSCAAAVSRGYSLATDDGRALKILTAEASTKVITTPRLLRQWVELSGLPPEEIGTMLRLVECRARFRLRESHPLYLWWREFSR